MRRLAPLFAPLREALIARSRTGQHWHADETRWQVFEATSEDACQRWCLWDAGVFTLDPTRSARVPKQLRDRDRRRGERRPLLIVQTVGQSAVVLLGTRAARSPRTDQEEWAEQWLAAPRCVMTQYAAADAALGRACRRCRSGGSAWRSAEAA